MAYYCRMDWDDAGRQLNELTSESYAEQLRSRRHFIQEYEVAAVQNAASKDRVMRVQIMLVLTVMLFSVAVAGILFLGTPRGELPTTLWASLTALLVTVVVMAVTFVTARHVKSTRFETAALIEELNRSWIRLNQLEMENQVLKKTAPADVAQTSAAGEPLD